MRSSERVRRAPLITFAGVEVVGLVTWLIVGRSDWFYNDEWDFLAGRKAGDAGDLFRPHNGHWTTVPLLVFRALYSVFGLRTYVPYRVVIVVLYLVAAALLLVVMRRTGINPWIATSAASFFVLFGAGWENILLPFQITFMGSFTFGLVYLLLADHDGPFDRRDWLGIVAGVLALMCSAVGLVMVGAAIFVVLLRRGWELALRHVVPTAACYVIWFVAIGHRDSSVGDIDAGAVVRFASTGVRAAFGALGPAPVFGIGFGAVLVVGFALAYRQRAGPARTELAVPIALLAGGLALLVLTALNGWGFGDDWARQSRYVSLIGAMALPALAVAADALVRRWHRLLPFAIALFLVGIPSNFHEATQKQELVRARDQATRLTMVSLAHDPGARRVPRRLRPEPTTAPSVSIGWLLDAERLGQMPAAPRLTTDLAASNEFRLSFVTGHGRAPSAGCRTTRHAFVIDLREGDRIGYSHAALYLAPDRTALVGRQLLYPSAAAAQTIDVLRDAGSTRVTPVGPDPLRLCINRSRLPNTNASATSANT